MADLYRLLIKNDDGKTKVVLGHKDQHGVWTDLEGFRYFPGEGVLPQAERVEKDGTRVKWTLLDTASTGRKVGK